MIKTGTIAVRYSTIESMQSQLYGLFEPLKKDSINNSLYAEPVWNENITSNPGTVFN
jgi:hypothetical protein